MKFTGNFLPRRSQRVGGIQQALALVLAFSPTLIFGYNPPSDQRPPYDRGGGTGFRPAEIGEIIPLSL